MSTEALVKHQFLGSILRFSYLVGLGEQLRILFLVSSQMTILFLDWIPHFKDYYVEPPSVRLLVYEAELNASLHSRVKTWSPISMTLIFLQEWSGSGESS